MWEYVHKYARVFLQRQRNRTPIHQHQCWQTTAPSQRRPPPRPAIRCGTMKTRASPIRGRCSTSSSWRPRCTWWWRWPIGTSTYFARDWVWELHNNRLCMIGRIRRWRRWTLMRRPCGWRSSPAGCAWPCTPGVWSRPLCCPIASSATKVSDTRYSATRVHRIPYFNHTTLYAWLLVETLNDSSVLNISTSPINK